MRKITPWQVTLFFLLFSGILVLSIATGYVMVGGLPLGDFRGIAIVMVDVVLIYLYAFVIYRLFLHFMPLMEGELVEGSREEFGAQVNALFYLVLFNSLIRTHFLPVPLMRLIYQALGTRMGENTYSVGVLLDPPLTELGSNCIIGHDAVLFCHAIEGRRFALSRIQMGDNVTVGAGAIILPGVKIGNGAIVSAGAVVLKDTEIGQNEVWGGVPAKRLR
ncbi:MAG: transferase [Nitrosomonadales bacterium SCN 54-20]|nr:MAG: transferase [Nitrosomonadales bacterium SCN 54-20]